MRLYRPLSRQVFGAVALMLSVEFASAQQPPQVLDQIRSHRKGLAAWWVGNAGWLIKADDVLIGIDLDLSTANKISPPVIKAEELANELDVAFVSHHHGDHCNVPTIGAPTQGRRTPLVLPRTCLKRVAQMVIPQERLIVPEPGHPFGIKGIAWICGGSNRRLTFEATDRLASNRNVCCCHGVVQ